MAGLFTAFVATWGAALLWVVNGFDFAILGPAFAAGGGVLGFWLGPRVGHLFIYLAG